MIRPRRTANISGVLPAGVRRIAGALEDAAAYSKLGEERFDLIASNPPYVANGDPHLAQGDVRFEPQAALLGEDAAEGVGAFMEKRPPRWGQDT